MRDVTDAAALVAAAIFVAYWIAAFVYRIGDDVSWVPYLAGGIVCGRCLAWIGEYWL